MAAMKKEMLETKGCKEGKQKNNTALCVALSPLSPLSLSTPRGEFEGEPSISLVYSRRCEFGRIFGVVLGVQSLLFVLEFANSGFLAACPAHAARIPARAAA